jgi:hypothetical protein
VAKRLEHAEHRNRSTGGDRADHPSWRLGLLEALAPGVHPAPPEQEGMGLPGWSQHHA